jgi:hypothetical protein
MQQDKLREVLLVKAIEEADASGALIPVADRARASRDAMKSSGLATDQIAAGESRAKVSQVLAARAEQLLRPMVERHPMLEDLLARSGWPYWIGAALLVAACVSGFGLSAIHGSRHINILALPLLGLLAWNVIVYLVLLAFELRQPLTPGSTRLTKPSVRGVGRRLGPFVARIAQVDTVLGTAVRRFVADWSITAGPALAQTLRFWLHLAAATIALTFAIGFYLRGLVFHYDAVWESTFLDAPRVQWLIGKLFAFVAAVAGIELPRTIDQVRQLELLPDGTGGGDAAPWIHLIALTMLCFVVLPRLVLAGLAWFSSARLQKASHLPEPLPDYALRVLGAGGQGSQTMVSVIPFGFRPTGDTEARLAPLLRKLFGDGARGRLHSEIAYGDEGSFPAAIDGEEHETGGLAVLMSLAATPESENHGVVIIAARDRARHGQVGVPFQLLVDEATYINVPAERMSQRRAVWRDFAHQHDVEAVFVTGGGT